MTKPWSFGAVFGGEPEGLHFGEVELGEEGVVKVGQGWMLEFAARIVCGVTLWGTEFAAACVDNLSRPVYSHAGSDQCTSRIQGKRM